MPDARLVILRSANGEDDWTPVKPEDVPDWLRDPDVMGRLVAGYIAQGPVGVAPRHKAGILLPDELRPWYGAFMAEPLH